MKKGRIIIVNPKKFSWQTREIRRGGAKKLQVVSDFDRTITKCFFEGRRAPTLLGILRDRNYLSKEYARQAKELFNHYHPIEINTKIPLIKKKAKMLEWWQKHFELLINSGLNKKTIESAMAEADLHLRPGGRQFFHLLAKSSVPLVIFSAGGLGGESIDIFLRRRGLFLDNVQIIANSFDWDDDGRAVAVKEPIIHVFNKDETVVSKFPFFQELKKRPNVIVVGDSLGDAGMAKGLPHDQVLKIAFLNENEQVSLPAYRRDFDVIILGDASFYFINQLLAKIFRR